MTMVSTMIPGTVDPHRDGEFILDFHLTGGILSGTHGTAILIILTTDGVIPILIMVTTIHPIIIHITIIPGNTTANDHSIAAHLQGQEILPGVEYEVQAIRWGQLIIKG
jgi:hypothetical protein